MNELNLPKNWSRRYPVFGVNWGLIPALDFETLKLGLGSREGVIDVGLVDVL